MGRHYHTDGHAQPFPDDPVLEQQILAKLREMPDGPLRNVENRASAARFKDSAQFVQPLIAPLKIRNEIKGVFASIVTLGQVVGRISKTKIDAVFGQCTQDLQAITLTQLGR